MTSTRLESSLYQSRLRQVASRAKTAGLDGVLITPGPDLQYLLGSRANSFERLTCLVIPAVGDPCVVLPRLEVAGLRPSAAGDLGLAVHDWVDGVDPYGLVASMLPTLARTAISDSMPALHGLPLAAACGAPQVLATPMLRELRMRKEVAELDALRRAGAAIDRVHARMGDWLRPGRTEAEVGADIAAAIVEEGHLAAEFIIVGSGPHGADPHHEVSERVVEVGDVVVVDIGGPVQPGYFSDCTRTYCLGEPPTEVAAQFAVLQQAQQAGVEAVRPGATAGDVDAACRDALAAAGLSAAFVHRTGHGIGLSVHEEPYIVGGNDLVLTEGMAFSIEPGIYFPGRWGARIEDIVLVTADGCEPVNRRPHELTVLPT